MANRRLPKTLTAAVLAYAIAVTAWWLANSVFHDRSWLTVAATRYHHLALFALPVVVGLAVAGARTATRRNRVILATAVAVPALVFTGLHLPSRWPKAAPAEPTRPLLVLTFNVLNGNPDITRVAALVIASGADVACLQEVTVPHRESLTELLKDDYPHTAFAHSAFGGTTALFSRHTLEHVTVVPMPTGRPAIAAEVELHGRTVRLISAHLQYIGLAEVDGLAAWPARIRDRTNERDAQIETLFAWLDTRPELPTVLGTDANAVPLSHSTRRLRTRFHDAAATTGWTPRHTAPLAGWHDDTRLQKLDYLFLSPDLSPTHTWTTKDTAGSDHQPVLTVLSL